jgi:hypothetical protein
MIAFDVLASGVIQRTDEDGSVWCIPPTSANAEYRRYLTDQSTASPAALATQKALATQGAVAQARMLADLKIIEADLASVVPAAIV